MLIQNYKKKLFFNYCLSMTKLINSPQSNLPKITKPSTILELIRSSIQIQLELIFKSLSNIPILMTLSHFIYVYWTNQPNNSNIYDSKRDKSAVKVLGPN